MTIIRISKRENPFAQINRATIDDPALSFAASGLLCYLLARPDNWQVSTAQLAKAKRDGIDKIYSLINELKNAGYIEANRIRKPNGTLGTVEYTVFETANPHETDVLTTSGKSRRGETMSGKTTSGLTTSGKAKTNNNDVTHNEFSNNKTTTTETAAERTTSASGGGGGDLIWPEKIGIEDRDAIRQLGAAYSTEQIQAVLDTIAASKPKSVLRYAAKLFRAIADGTFTPEAAIVGSRNRKGKKTTITPVPTPQKKEIASEKAKESGFLKNLPAGIRNAVKSKRGAR